VSRLSAGRIVGKGISDRVLYALAPAKEEVLQLGDGGESFTFSGHGFVRVSRDTVNVTGDVRAISVKVSGTPKLLVNGKPAEASVESGVLHYQR